MGFRYRRSISLGSGVRLNVSKRGLSSVSIGKPGSTLNVGRRGVRSTVGLPGTGLSYSTGSGSGGGVIAILGLIGAVLGAAFWLLGAAARGSRLAQITVAGIAAFALFGYLRAPENGHAALTLASAPTPAPLSIAAEAPPTVAPVATPPAVLTGANIAALMKTTTGANMRSGPSLQAKVVQQLPAGALVEVVQGEGRWARIRTASGDAVGWVAWSLLTSLDSSTPPKILTTDRRLKSPESVFDPADISAILNAAPSTR